MKIRRVSDGFRHWCPACEHTHPLPDRWEFNGDPDRPTFTPSFKHSGKRQKIVNGQWTGEWWHDPDGRPSDGTCHYIITDGKIQFCPDSWHKRSDIVEMPDIPEGIEF